MLIELSGLKSGQSVRADLKVWPPAEAGSLIQAGYTFRTPAEEDIGIEVTVLRSPLGVAPELFHYEVTDWWGFDTDGPTTGTIDRRQHDLAYLWELGLGSQKFDVPRNLLPAWREANNTIGHKTVALRGEGLSEWSLTVVEPSSGKKVVLTGKDLVGAEQAQFFGDRVSFVDETGAFAGVPTDAKKYTSFAAALNAAETLSDPQLIIIEDGQTHIATKRNLSADFPSLRIRGRTAGGGARLVQDASEPFTNNGVVFSFTDYDVAKTKQFEVIDLRIDGQWDSTTETLLNGANHPCDFIKYAGEEASYQTLLNCKISGWKAAIRSTTSTGRMLGIYGTTITNWQDYGFYDSHTQSIPWSQTAVVNSEIAQHPAALCGGPKSSQPWHNTHGPYRTPNGSFMSYASYFFARNGWSAKSIDSTSTIDGAVDGSKLWDPNPCLRFGQAGARGASVMLRCCTLEGGGSVLSIKGANTERADRPVNMILGQFIAVMGPRTRNLLAIGYSGVTLEAFHATRTGGRVISDHFEFQPLLFSIHDQTENQGGASADPDALTQRVRFRNWTYLNMRSDDEAFSGQSVTYTGLNALDSDSFTDLKATNYVLHSTSAVEKPAVSFSPVSIVPLSDLGPNFEYSEKGYRDDVGDPQPAILWADGQPQYVPESGSPDSSMALAVPQQSSPAVEGADELTPDALAIYDLFKGLLAPPVPGYQNDRGAIILSR